MLLNILQVDIGKFLFCFCWFPLAQLVIIHLQCRRSRFDSWVRKIPWKKCWPLTPVFLGFPDCSVSKESARGAGDLGLIPGLVRAPGEGHGDSLLYSCLESCQGQRSLAGYTVYVVTKTWTRPSD